ncbi:unnamed protein product [Cuscuta epithymum]|uniref:HTH myb-type domain-containing protein n=1 Tax=Cuscuta epithymum TaxID=186058 RepID=A0AAV0C5D1_9ASTE|nr:unnamed protein product [Cuscuta epithymum]
MREDDSNWFAKWEDELPSPDELTPISQTLITPDLAIAFDIQNPQSHPPPSSQAPLMADSSAEFDSELGCGGGGGGGPSGSGGGDEPARTLKRPRLVWTPQLHKRFVDAVAHLGIKNAVPKTIMQLMSVDGLTRENVASHLQKYRLYLKRMQGLSNGGGGGGSSSASGGVDPATDHLFASSPVPAHFLHPVRSNSDHFLPFVPVVSPSAAMQHPGHHMAAAAVVGHHHPQLQQPYGLFGSPPNGHFDHSSFLSRQSHQQIHRIGGAPYLDDVESATSSHRRKVLTLFPTGGD